jgi:ABC-type transporter Mla subunit MlaD
MAKAAAYPQPGTGIVYTKLVSVGGAVTFDFNLTPSYQGAAAHIYLSANGLPNVYYGDVPITPTFKTTNVTAVVGSWPITATDVANFITALSTYGSTEDAASSGATQETVVLHNLTTQGWALVYLKYSTSAPVNYGGTAPAIAAGPFNLTIRPNMEVTIKPLNNLSVATPLCLPTSPSAFLNITGVGAYASGLISSTVSNLANYNLTLLGSFANSTVSTKSATIAFISTSKSVYYSQVFTTPVSVNFTSTPPSIGVKGTLNSTFAPPALTNSVHFSSGAVTSYFNISDFSLDVVYNKPITVVPASGTTYVEFFPSGTYQYGTTTGTAAALNLTVINYTLSNYGVNPSTFKPYGLFTPSPAAGTLDIFPSFQVTGENTYVAGPTNELNPGDELTLTFYNLPSGTSFVAVTAIGNGTLLLTSPYLYPAEENSESYYNGSGYFVESLHTIFANNTFTYITSTTTSGEATVDVLIPNAPYYPFAELGLEYEITYTPELVSGTISPYAYVSNCTLWYSGAPLEVYPFYQVFTSNANGMFYFNGTSTTPEVLLFGNYLLVRGFGFSTSISSSEYPVIMNSTTGAIAATTLAPITSVQTDGYGDFAYISQVPISGSFYNFLVTKIPTTGYYEVPAYVPMSNASSNYEVYLSANPNSAIVYVDPMPVVYPPTPIVTGLLGEIQMPMVLFKYPFEATQYITNGTTHLIPVRNGTIGEIVVVGAGANANVTTGTYGSVVLKFYLGYSIGSVNVSQVAPFGDSGFSGTWVLGGYGVFYNVPVPDLAGSTSGSHWAYGAYSIAIANVTSLPGGGESGPAYTKLFVGTAADLLIGTYSLAYMLTNFTTGAAVYYYSPLANQSILVLPGTPVTAYVFGANMIHADVYLYVLPQCGIMLQTLFRPPVVGYIINGTLWSISPTGQYVKGVHLTAGTTLPLCSGLNSVFLVIGYYQYYLTQFFTLNLNYISEIPAYPVQFTLTAPGSVSAGTALEVLASGQVSVMGLPAYRVSPFFKVSAPTVTAYVVTSSGVVEQVPVSLLTTIPDEYYVYLVSVPSNASGTLFVEATVTATYIFTGQQFVGQQAAAVGILPPINTTAISSVVSQAVKEIEANVTGEIGQVESNMANYYSLLSLQLTATQQKLANYIVSNASALQTALSSLGVQLSGQVTTAQQTLAGYMAGNFSAVFNYLSSVNSTLSKLSSDVSQLSAIASNLEGVASQLSSLSTYMAGNFSEIESSLSSISSYMASNFSAISSGISTLEGDVAAVGGEVGSIGANVLELMKSVNTLTSYETAALNYLTSMNSTLGSVSSTLSSVSSTLSSVSSTVSSMSSTLSGVSSSLGTISSDLSTIGSDLSSISSTLSSMSGTLSSVSSTLSSVSSTVSSMSSTLSSTSSTASNAYTEATHAAQLAASAATYSLAALIVAIIALALIAYVAFAKM